MRWSWWLVLAAIGGSAIAAPVPLLVVDPPPAFDVGKLERALDTYVPNAKVAIAAASAAGCDEALAAAHAASSPVALWLHWSAGGVATVERVGEAGCGAVEASTVEVDQPAFVYRVVALKVASLVRELPKAPPVAVPVPLPVPLPAAPVRPMRRVVELGASVIADADPIYFASAGAWIGDAWAFGGELRVGLAHDDRAAGGQGSTRSFAAFAGVRRRIVDRGAWSIDIAAELGAIGVHGSAMRTNATSETSDDVWTAAAAIAPRIRFAVLHPLAISVGPTLELLARPVELDLGVSPLYHAGRVRLRGDLQVELSF